MFEGFLFMDPPPIFLPLLIFGYVVMIFLGPIFMEKREAFKLDREMKIYNAIQIFANSFLVIWVNFHNFSHILKSNYFLGWLLFF